MGASEEVSDVGHKCAWWEQCPLHCILAAHKHRAQVMNVSKYKYIAYKI